MRLMPSLVGSVVIGLSTGPPPPLPDLTFAEPQVRSAIVEDHDAIIRMPDDARAWGRYAGRLAAHEYLVEAVAAWQQAQALDPDNFRWPYLTGVYLLQDAPEAAHAAFEQAMKLNDRYPPLLVRWGALMERLGRPGDATRAYRSAVELAPRNAYAHAALGARMLDDGDMATARDCFERAVHLDPDCRPALSGLVTVHRLDGDLAKADDLARRAAAAPKARPPDPVLSPLDQLSVSTSAVILRAAEMTAAGRDGDAIAALRALVAANPDSARGRTELADRLRDQGNLVSAEREYRVALAIVPDLLAARVGLAQCLVQSRRFEDAVTAYERAIAEHPTSAEAHSGLAVCLAVMGRYDRAAERFRAALKLAPESRLTRVGYGRSLARSGDFTEAAAVLRPVVDDVATTPDALSMEAVRLYAVAMARTGHADEAIPPLRRALRAEPTRSDIRRQLAGMLTRVGLDGEAADLLRDGMALQPRGAMTGYALAQLLATSPDDSVRDGVYAVQLAERWLKAPGQAGDGTRLDILACAYAEAGRFEEAQHTAERAIAMARKAGKPDLAAAMTARLELFKQGQAFRTP